MERAVGIDDFQAEFVKYADEKVHSVIADIYNTAAETGNLPREINTVVRLPLQKPKPKNTDEPCANNATIHSAQNPYHHTAETNLGPASR